MKGGSIIATEVAEPYAQAYMALAQSHGLIDQFGADAASLLQLLTESEDLSQLLATPIIKPAQKKAVLEQITRGQVHPYTHNFLLLLVDRRRIQFLESILKQYQALLRELRKTVLAEVTSAVDLTEEQQQAVCDRVLALTGAEQVELQTRIDPDLIGGVIIKVGSQVIDASLRGQLRRISLQLSSGR